MEQKNKEAQNAQDELVELGSDLSKGSQGNIYTLTIIGQIEGHQVLPETVKTTKYEHILPLLAGIEESEEIDGLLLLLNTVGGDIEAGLAIAEMIASLSKPTVSLVLGGSHSIGVPIAVSTDYSFIVPTGTMVIHPVRMNGMVIGVQQTFDYFLQIQNRITGFVCEHCRIQKERMEELMMETKMLTKDVGTILVGAETVEEGIIPSHRPVIRPLPRSSEALPMPAMPSMMPFMMAMMIFGMAFTISTTMVGMASMMAKNISMAASIS